jgi:bifunctional enzyme CysN/CysC
MSYGCPKCLYSRGGPTGLKLATQTVTATIQPPQYQINVSSQKQLLAKTLDLNAIGVATVSMQKPRLRAQ